MCGICGILGLEDKKLTQDMMEVMRHRGPDDRGTHFDSGISLGHLRLSIIDLSARGRQPLSNEDGTVWITYNGEVYNFKELKSLLEAKGHVFKSDTDTEAIVHAYEEYGTDCVKRLRGMFAFAIWDSQLKHLFLARDRFGKKPLYYTQIGGVFYFASELKALLRIPGFKREIDPISLDNYLSLQYVPGPRTMLKKVSRLPPAHTMTVSADGVNIERYWDLDLTVNINQTIGEATTRVLSLLRESVRMRLMSDVPLGAFLSGGLDSSTLVYLMSEIKQEPVKTFSIGYGVSGVDETAYAEKVAQHLGTDHHEIMLESGDVLKELDNIIWHLDEPIADAALLPLYFLCKFTRKEVTVTFGGGGSDEIFGGYRAYKYAMLSQQVRDSLPQALRGPLFGALKNVGALPYRARKYLEYVSAKEGEYFYEGQGILLPQDEKKDMCTQDFRAQTAGNNPLAIAHRNFWQKNPGKTGFLNRLLITDIKGWLTDDCLAQYDRLSMAHALEARAPFLDHVLVEYCATIPQEYKINGWTEKYILRQAMDKRLPPEIIERRKRGFTVPTDQWLFNPLWEYTTQALDKGKLVNAVIDKEKMTRLLNRRGDFRISTKVFGLLMLQEWNRIFIEEGR